MQKIVGDIQQVEGARGNGKSHRSRFKRLMAQRGKFSRRMMLQARIDSIESGLVHRHGDSQPHVEPENVNDRDVKSERKAAIKQLASNARRALDLREFERAWRNVIEAERLVLSSLTDAALGARGSTLVVEAPAVLPSSEAQPILEALAGATADKKDATAGWRDKIIEAQYLFERRIIHLFDVRERTGTRIMILSIVLLALTGCLLLYILNTDQTSVTASSMKSLAGSTVVLSLLFGGIGACLSALVSFTSQGRVPGMFEGVWGTFARPLVGAVSGLIGVMLVGSGLVSLGDNNVVAVTVVPFVFGFSERLVLGTVQKLEAAQKV